ncbi:MAG: hypothetical protein RMM07_11935 [Anaerolineae bacterium]|nr:hypothetical protein [Anaerolineae bacterium]
MPDFYTVPQPGLLSGAVCDPSGCPRFWALRMGAPRPELSFYFFVRGCFYPGRVVGGQVRDWGMPYPVICAVSQDIVPYWWIGVSADGTEFFRREYRDLWGRGTRFFGYDPGLRMWLQIGSSRVEDPEAKKVIARLVREDGRSFARDRAARHGQPVWDGAWLQETFGLEMKPPPEGWEEWPDRLREFYGRRGEAVERAKEEWSR